MSEALCLVVASLGLGLVVWAAVDEWTWPSAAMALVLFGLAIDCGWG